MRIVRCSRSILYRGVEQLEARRAHNPEVVGSSPASATIKTTVFKGKTVVFLYKKFGFLGAAFPSFPLWLTFSQLHCLSCVGFQCAGKHICRFLICFCQNMRVNICRGGGLLVSCSFGCINDGNTMREKNGNVSVPEFVRVDVWQVVFL